MPRSRIKRQGTIGLILAAATITGACSSSDDPAAEATTTEATVDAPTTEPDAVPFGDVIAYGNGADARTWADIKPETTPVETSYGTVYVLDWPGPVDPTSPTIGLAGMGWMEDCTGDTASLAGREIDTEQLVSVPYVMCLPEWAG